jgi:hypothetical protein
MAKIPRTIRWGFDPGKSDITVLSTQRGRDVWGAIRVNHVVDQHFNDQLYAFLDYLERNGLPDNPDRLNRIAAHYGVHVFGRLGNSLDTEW